MDKQTIAFKLLFCLHFYTLTQQDNLEPFTSFISQQNGLGKNFSSVCFTILTNFYLLPPTHDLFDPIHQVLRTKSVHNYSENKTH